MTTVIIGAGGAIGRALVDQCLHAMPSDKNASEAPIIAISRNPVQFDDARVQSMTMDYNDDSSLMTVAKKCAPITRLFLATGILHQSDDAGTLSLSPEKALRDLDRRALETVFQANTIFPAMVMKYFLPQFARKGLVTFAALSARVGSIGDNRLGGWYAYRASKAALNMLIKTASIEMTRRNPDSVVIGLHPGTVDSSLSKPFQRGVPPEKLFTPAYSAECLYQVATSRRAADTGKVFDWAGTEIIR